MGKERFVVTFHGEQMTRLLGLSGELQLCTFLGETPWGGSEPPLHQEKGDTSRLPRLRMKGDRICEGVWHSRGVCKMKRTCADTPVTWTLTPPGQDQRADRLPVESFA